MAMFPAPASTPAPARPRPEVAKAIARFEKPVRRRLRAMAATSPRLGDLILTCPGAAYALAAEQRVDRAPQAIRLVKDGAKLAEVTEALGLPLWLRRLPPEAFAGPIGPLPLGPEADRRMPATLPTDVRLAAGWLRAVSAAYAAGDAATAVWTANAIQGSDAIGPRGVARSGAPFAALAAFAWCSRSATAGAARPKERPWHPKISLLVAVQAARGWWVDVLEQVGAPRPKARRVRKVRRGGGFEAVRLLSPRQLTEEGEAMRHCVATYAPAVLSGARIVFGVRYNGARVATVEVWRDQRSGRLRPAQLYGPGNAPVSERVRMDVEAWLASDPDVRTEAGALFQDARIPPTRWRGMFGPYLKAKGPHAGVPAEPTPDGLQALAEDLAALDALAAV